MNRKLLALLLFLPLMLFVVDQSFSTGGKEGAKQTTASKTDQKSSLPLSNLGVENEAARESESSDAYSGPAKGGGSAEETAMAAAILKTIRKLETAYHGQDLSTMNPYNYESSGHESEANFLDKEVRNALQSISPMSVSPASSFSRCGTYYTYRILTDEQEQPTDEGIMIFSSGCNDEILGQFRFDYASRKLEVLISLEHGYASMEDYFKLYALSQS